MYGNIDIIGDMSLVADEELADLLATSMGEDVPAMGPSGAAAIRDKLLGRNATLIRELGYTKSREYPLGFDSGAVIAAAASQAVTTQPQVVFRVERLVVPSDIGGSFVIDDVVVGKNSQFAATNVGVPARTFDERAVGVRLRGDTAKVSQNVTIQVTNIGGAGIRFRACVIGSVIE
jgi:hypothetical protein